MSLRRRMMMGGMKGQKVPTNQIWYTTTDGNNIDFTLSGLTMISNTFDGKKWVAEFDGDVTSIGNYTFSYRIALASITIPDSVTSIGEGAFQDCSSLIVTIPDSVTTIGGMAFSGVPIIFYNGTATGSPWGASLLNPYIDGDFAFSDSSKTTLLKYLNKTATSVTIPDSVTTIGNSAFSSCSSLTSVTIPDSVTTIGNGAFAGCSSLTSVTIPDSVTTIGHMAFMGCSSLIVTIPDSVTTIGGMAFSGVPIIFYNGTATGSPWEASLLNPYIEGDFAFSDSSKTTLLKYLNKTATSITIPDSVTSIGYSAFGYCSSLASVTIPDSVTSIGSYVFQKCTALTSITIGNSVTTIDIGAFNYCSSLVSVTIPDSVTSIGNQAFNYCSSLTSVTIGNSVTSIGSSAFYDCSTLTSVTIPDSVTSIGYNAFGNVQHIEYHGTATGSPWGAKSMN